MIDNFLKKNELESTQEPQEISEGFLIIDRSNYDKFIERIREDLQAKKLEIVAEFEKKQRLEKENLLKSFDTKSSATKEEEKDETPMSKKKGYEI